ncbi:MAG: DoxX family protein [Sneathiella sp.]
MDKGISLIELVGRIFLSIMFIMSGFSKISGYEGTQGYMEAMGVPGMLLPLVILLELGGGILLAVGFQVRIIAFLLAGFCLLSAMIFHFQPAEQMQMIMFMKNITIAGGLLLVLVHGAGTFSVDAKLKKA